MGLVSFPSLRRWGLAWCHEARHGIGCGGEGFSVSGARWGLVSALVVLVEVLSRARRPLGSGAGHALGEIG